MATEHEADLAMLARSLQHTTTRLNQRPNDIWNIDAPFYDSNGRSERGRNEHDDYFTPLLKAVGVRDFKELMAMRTLAGLPTDVLELFGSEYFIADYLHLVDSITGVRLLDSSQELVRQLPSIMIRNQN